MDDLASVSDFGGESVATSDDGEPEMSSEDLVLWGRAAAMSRSPSLSDPVDTDPVQGIPYDTHSP